MQFTVTVVGVEIAFLADFVANGLVGVEIANTFFFVANTFFFSARFAAAARCTNETRASSTFAYFVQTVAFCGGS